MSNHKDNNTDKRLKDFLDTAKNSSEDAMDDFDREALEGFDGIESQEEILELKAQLDKRAYQEVFTKEKKSLNVIWYAAAGLFVVIGFSVYFIKNDPSSKRNDLAVHQKNEVLSAVEEEPKKEADEENRAEKATADSSPASKKEEAKEQPFKNARLKSNKDVKPLSDMEETAEQSAMDLQEIAVTASSMNVAKTLSIPKEEENALVMKEEVNKNTPAAGALSPPAVSPNDMMVSTLVVEEEKSASKEKSLKKSEARARQADAAMAEDSFVSSCYYTGGEETLLKDLRTLLQEKNLLMKFNVTLFINENKKVEKVVFTNSFGMTDSQQEKVKEVLKQLSQFNLNNPGSSRSLAEYQLVFKP